MHKPAFLVVLSSALLSALFWAVPAAAGNMTLTSQDIAEGGTIGRAQIYGDCNGDNVSPELHWSGAPAETKSFAVTLFDPDAPAGGWWHWIVFDLPEKADALPRGAGDRARILLPGSAIQGTNDFGSVGYGGPCPPAGDKPHRYDIELWALDAMPDFKPTVTGSGIQPWLKQHALATATLTATYGR